MEAIITSNIKSFLFSKGLISDHQFRFRPGHSSLDLQLLLSQQWMKVLNARHEIRAIFLDISCAFDTVWHPALLTKLSSYGIQGILHSWLADFLSCHSQRVALFLVFINDLSDWKILFISLLMTPPSAVPSVIPQIGKQQLLHSLQVWVKSQAGPTRGTCLSSLVNLTLSHCLSERTVWKKTPSTFSTVLLKKSSHSNFWASMSAMIFPGKATSPSWPPEPVVTGNPTSCKVLPWHT